MSVESTGLRPIDNLSEYLYLKNVRQSTALIGGKIFYDGLFWSEEEYNANFPKPILKYSSIQLDGTQLLS